ncbi:hypothetical protein [Stenomitos frigidus]|uniref:Uncharacterized protein n=1 Tax=Stenomitos frigidus ULC18 TaxID=2107698 RepID=A0A2T1EFI3_9CYAN|nr:hypothetical protein [Stenomitos frigidus]PSB31502.1 hypothetical protein C7B82_07390 [Stenomitos frigidus ULC18]
MKLAALKQKAYETWQTLYTVEGAFVQISTPVHDQVFKQEVRSYGDLRRKQTWEKAFTSLLAKLLYDHNDDARTLILLHFLTYPEQEGFADLRPLLVEQFLMFPYGLDCLREGLNDIAQRGTSGYSTSVSTLQAFAHECHTTALRLGLGRAAEPATGRTLQPAA